MVGVVQILHGGNLSLEDLPYYEFTLPAQETVFREIMLAPDDALVPTTIPVFPATAPRPPQDLILARLLSYRTVAYTKPRRLTVDESEQLFTAFANRVAAGQDPGRDLVLYAATRFAHGGLSYPTTRFPAPYRLAFCLYRLIGRDHFLSLPTNPGRRWRLPELAIAIDEYNSLGAPFRQVTMGNHGIRATHAGIKEAGIMSEAVSPASD